MLMRNQMTSPDAAAAFARPVVVARALQTRVFVICHPADVMLKWRARGQGERE